MFYLFDPFISITLNAWNYMINLCHCMRLHAVCSCYSHTWWHISLHVSYIHFIIICRSSGKRVGGALLSDTYRRIKRCVVNYTSTKWSLRTEAELWSYSLSIVLSSSSGFLLWSTNFLILSYYTSHGKLSSVFWILYYYRCSGLPILFIIWTSYIIWIPYMIKGWMSYRYLIIGFFWRIIIGIPDFLLDH